MSSGDRKESPLADDGDVGFPWGGGIEQTVAPARTTPESVASPTAAPEPASDSPANGDQDEAVDRPRGSERLPEQYRSGRPARKSRNLDPHAKVAVNYNIPLFARQAVRRLATEWEMYDQEVILEALLDLFEREGVEVPSNRSEYNQMVRAGRM